MNRRTFITIAFCVGLLATIGGVSAAPQDPKMPPQYRVVPFNVTYHDSDVGKLIINTNQWTWVFNAHGLQPGTQYYLFYQGKIPGIDTAVADEKGDLHMQGAWDPQTNIVDDPEFLPPVQFELSDSPRTGYNIGASLLTYYWFSPVNMNVHGQLTDPWNWNAPIVNQTIEIKTWSIIHGHYVHWASVKTDSEGRFSVTKAALPRVNPPLVWTPPDPQFDYCRPLCCGFMNNGEYYNCVYSYPTLDF